MRVLGFLGRLPLEQHLAWFFCVVSLAAGLPVDAYVAAALLITYLERTRR